MRTYTSLGCIFHPGQRDNHRTTFRWSPETCWVCLKYGSYLAQNFFPYAWSLVLGTPAKHLSLKFCRKIVFFATVNKSCFRWKCYARRPYKQFWGNHWKLFCSKTPETFRFIKEFLVQLLKARVEGSFEGTIPTRSAQNQRKTNFPGFSGNLFSLKMFSWTLMRAILTKVKKKIFQTTENHWCIRNCLGLFFLSMPGKMFWTAPAKLKISRSI